MRTSLPIDNTSDWRTVRLEFFDPFGNGPQLLGDLLQEIISDSQSFADFSKEVANGRKFQLGEAYFFWIQASDADAVNEPDAAFIACEFFDGLEHEGPIQYDLLKKLLAVACLYHSLLINDHFDPWSHINSINERVEKIRKLAQGKT